MKDSYLVRRVILLAGPSGSGKSHLARESGLPVLALDDFYRGGDDAHLPRDPDLGIIDWDDPLAWNAEVAVEAITAICREGHADVPVYDIAHDHATSTQRFDAGSAQLFVAEGLFAAEIIAPCRERGLLADALLVHRRPWLNFVRRLFRDLAEHRKPPLTLKRRGRALLRAERAVVRRQITLGARPSSAAEVRRLLAQHSSLAVSS